MAKSRHSVVCLQMSQTLQTSQPQTPQRAPAHPHRPHGWATSRRGCRLVHSQPHTEVQRDHIQLLHPWIVARKQSRGWQNRQASRIAAQRSRKERMKLLFSVKREQQDCARLLDVPTCAGCFSVGCGRPEALTPCLLCFHGRWTTDRCCPHQAVGLVHSSRRFCS